MQNLDIVTSKLSFLYSILVILVLNVCNLNSYILHLWAMKIKLTDELIYAV